MIGENIILQAAGIEAGSHLAKVVEGRADIIALSQATHDAILTPREPGGLSYAERALLVCRIARLNGDELLAEYYATLVSQNDITEATMQMADPAFTGDGNPRVTALLRHVDLVTQSPKEATSESIAELVDSGIDECDVVRLAELIAFINYQIRVVNGLRLMGERA